MNPLTPTSSKAGQVPCESDPSPRVRSCKALRKTRGTGTHGSQSSSCCVPSSPRDLSSRIVQEAQRQVPGYGIHSLNSAVQQLWSTEFWEEGGNWGKVKEGFCVPPQWGKDTFQRPGSQASCPG